MCGGEVGRREGGHGIEVWDNVAVDDGVATLASGIEAANAGPVPCGSHGERGAEVEVVATSGSGEGEGVGQRDADLLLQIGLGGSCVEALGCVGVEVEHDHPVPGADADQG
jgi:hypothetical protein